MPRNGIHLTTPLMQYQRMLQILHHIDLTGLLCKIAFVKLKIKTLIA